ncbi:universal stress protein [Antrihabitans spumae]|uniref:Universal stress protein n=1 Tax=Antrihabitans spumae TaxID=3373370 RepID=A0ABW7KC78_9NOCA
MDAYPGILVGADGSSDSEVAIELGATLAVGLAVGVTVVTVWDGYTNVPEPQSFEWAREASETAQAKLRSLGVTDVSVLQPTGTPADQLVAVSADHPDSLLIVGGASLGNAKDRVLGSVANRLSHHSESDVLFAHHTLPARWQSIALTTDGSTTSRQSVRRGMQLAHAMGATPHLVTVAKDQEEGERLMSASIGELEFDEPDTELVRDVLIGLLPAKALVEAGPDYDLMVIGNRGMSGASRLLGSVANKVTHGLETNLLLVNTSSD